MIGREIVALADLERQHAVLAGALDQRRIAVRREGRARIAGGTPDDVAIAAAHDDVGEIGREHRPFRHRQQMALALRAGDFDQHLFVDDGRSAQQRSCDGNLVLMRELADQPARRIGEQRQPLGQIGARGEFGMRDQTGQHAVEQIDVIGAEVGGTLQEQFADPARGIGAAFRVATTDNVVKFRDQRGRRCHKPVQTGRIGRFFGNLGGLRE